MSEWRQLKNIQLYHGENKLNFQWDVDKVRFVLDAYVKLDFYIARSLKQQSADRHVVPLDALSWFRLRANQSLFFLLNAACIPDNKQLPIL